jgi:hypothetical protein
MEGQYRNGYSRKLEGLGSTDLDENRDNWRAFVSKVMNMEQDATHMGATAWSYGGFLG